MTHRDPRERPLLLASSSPRRRELLRRVGLRFRSVAVDVDERWRAGESPARGVRRLAAAKAAAAAERFPRCDVLAADTIVAVAGQVLGKPRGRAEAAEMLRALSGDWHEVLTGVVLRVPGRRPLTAHARTRVRFVSLTAEEIERYLASDEPYDKAGAYAIQGAAGWFVAEVRGSVSNVIGLPLETVRELFLRAGRSAPSFGA